MNFRCSLNIVAYTLLAMPVSTAAAQEMTADARIAEAVSPLPESLRAGATVVSYDAAGRPKVLRQGSNGITCSRNWPLPTMPFGVQCYAAALVPQHDMMVKLLASGKSHEDASAEVTKAIESGKLQLPAPGTMTYTRSGKSLTDSKVLWILHLPNAKAESLGLPTTPGHGSPWMMLSGTPRAHVMLPQTEASLAAAPSTKP
jgi:hypothetical protein